MPLKGFGAGVRLQVINSIGTPHFGAQVILTEISQLLTLTICFTILLLFICCMSLQQETHICSAPLFFFSPQCWSVGVCSQVLDYRQTDDARIKKGLFEPNVMGETWDCKTKVGWSVVEGNMIIKWCCCILSVSFVACDNDAYVSCFFALNISEYNFIIHGKLSKCLVSV